MTKPHGRIRRFLTILLILILAGLIVYLGVIGMLVWKVNHVPSTDSYDAIVVLGAQVKADGTPSVALERRLTAALESYREKPQVIIVCGGQGGNEPRAEGDVMREWLLAQGVPEADVVAETDSVNTRENLRYARAIMEERGLTQALVVTSDYHVARALALCRQEGISATGKGSPSKPEYFIKNHLREGLSWVKLWTQMLLGTQEN